MLNFNITIHRYRTFTQIADFGMARDVSDDTYYMSTGGKVPLKWTAPEVNLSFDADNNIVPL